MPYPSLLFVHGAANAAWVWDVWRRHLRPFGWETNVLDLRGHGRSLPVDFSTVTMEDYVSDLESVTAQIAAQGRQPAVIGWSMGGLVAMIYAAKREDVPALVLFSPSPPKELLERASAEELSKMSIGPYGPEIYGIDPGDRAASRTALPDLTDEEAASVIANSKGAEESGLARRQRRRGLSVPEGAITCPTLLIYGEDDTHFAPDQNRRLAAHLGAESLAVESAGHWGVVYHEAAVAETALKLDTWLRRTLKK